MSSARGYYNNKSIYEEARKKFTDLTGESGHEYTTEELIEYSNDMEAYHKYYNDIENTIDEDAKKEFLIQHKAKGSPKLAWRERRVHGK